MREDAALPFGELLRKHRSSSGLSQEALADRAAISAAAIGALERGRRRAPYEVTVASLADALQLAPADRAAFIEAAERTRGRKSRVSQASSADDLQLPITMTSFIERPEVDQLKAVIRENRLITITGSGGVGKTRTAIEAVKRLGLAREDVCFVDLSEIEHGQPVAAELAAMLKPAIADGEAYLTALERSLSERSLLLVLDNCEHLIRDVGATADALLKAAQKLTILVTSREPLGLPNEIVYRLPQLPDEVALELMLARAYSDGARPPASSADFEILAGICHDLASIPLAIELAAAHLQYLGPATLRARLHDALALAGPLKLPPRQRTIEATIAWSFSLLDTGEQILLRRLSVFAGGFTLDAAERVCFDELLPLSAAFSALAGLVRKSLVNVCQHHPEARYTMLESVQTFARERLRASAEEMQTRRAHLRWMLELTRAFVSSRPRQSPAHLFDEFENIQRAIRYGMGSDYIDDVLISGEIAGRSRLLWFALERPAELRALAGGVLSRLNDRDHPAVVAQLCVAISTTWTSREPEMAFAYEKRAIPLLILAEEHELAASVSMQLAAELTAHGRFNEAEEIMEASSAWIDGAAGNKSRNYVNALYNRAQVYRLRSQFDLARADLSRILDLVDGSSDPDNHFRIYVAILSGEIEAAVGNYALGIAQVEAIIDRFQTASSEPRTWMAAAHANVASYYLLSGEREKCLAFASEAVRVATAVGYEPFAEPILYIAGAMALAGDLEHAAVLLGYVDATYRRIGLVFWVTDILCRDIVTDSLRALSPETRAAREADGARRSFAEIAEAATRRR